MLLCCYIKLEVQQRLQGSISWRLSPADTKPSHFYDLEIMTVRSLLLTVALCAITTLASAASNFAARTNPHVVAEKRAAAVKRISESVRWDQDGFVKRTASTTGVKNITFANPRASQFYVDGAHIPEVDFDIGPSWAGLLPISSNANETRELFFWFFPPGPGGTLDDLIFWYMPF
jgi:carboxypeptidase D